jgi:hypothetical protein
MQIRKYRWSRTYESAEEELLQIFRHRKIDAKHWAKEGGDTIPDRVYTNNTTLWCAEGSLGCIIGDKTYSLQPGDALDIPANTSCALNIGFSGCACYESPVKGSAY